MPERYEDPATARLPHVRYDDPAHNPIAFLPADQPQGRVSYGEAVDYFDPSRAPATFTTEDGAVYERPDPDEFPDFDEVDSTTIVDNGGPPDE